MTNSGIYERMSSLYEKLGISYPDGSEEQGELMAYCTAIDALQNTFDSYFSQMFADTANGLGLSLFCEMLKIDSTLSDEEKRNLMKQGLAQQYGDYSCGTIEREIENLGSPFSVTSESFCITVNGSFSEDAGLLPRLGKIFENYLPPCTVAKCSGDGMNFDYWDSATYLWEDYDNLGLSYEVLDTLK